MKQLLVIIFFLLMFACVHARKEDQYNIRSKDSCIKLAITPPCAGYLCDGYLIDIKLILEMGLYIYKKNTVLENNNVILKNTVDSIKGILSQEKVDSINILISEITSFKFTNVSDALDVWIYSIEINNKNILSLNSAYLYEKSNNVKFNGIEKTYSLFNFHISYRDKTSRICIHKY